MYATSSRLLTHALPLHLKFSSLKKIAYLTEIINVIIKI